MDAPPETRYARNGLIHLAYQVLGSGPPDLLVVNSGPNSHVDYMWAEPSVARFLRRLASFSRLIVYDSRGVGLSDPVAGGAVPAMGEQVDDIRTVLDEVGSRRAVIAGHLAGCAPALMFAAAHPERVQSLILLGGYARLRRGADYPDGVAQAHIDQITDLILAHWGTGDDLDFTNPSKADDEEFRRWYAQISRMSASPATAAAMARLWFEVDVRAVLPAIKVPALVMARATNVIYPAQNTRYLAEHITGAKYIEFPDTDLLYFTGNADQVLDAIEEFITGARPLPSPDRFLGTVLFVDVAGSTQLAAEIGDSPFRDLIDSFHQLRTVRAAAGPPGPRTAPPGSGRRHPQRHHVAGRVHRVVVPVRACDLSPGAAGNSVTTFGSPPPARQPARRGPGHRAPGERRVTALAIPDRVCENNRMARHPGSNG